MQWILSMAKEEAIEEIVEEEVEEVIEKEIDPNDLNWLSLDDSLPTERGYDLVSLSDPPSYINWVYPHCLIRC